MSRFADVKATRTADLGPCECPGTPHDNDWAKVRAEYSGSDTSRIADASTEDELEAARILAEYVVEWNLLDPDGKAWPPSAESLVALKGPTLSAIMAEISTGIADSVTVPNPSSVPSPASSRGSASATRKPRRMPTT